MRKIVLDIETKNLFQDVGTNNPADLDISVVCIHDSLTDSYSSYLQEDLKKLWPVLENADIIIGFNSNHFDIPLLNKYYSGDLTKIKSVDLLAEIHKSLGRRIKLDNVAEATLGKNKSGHGLEAITWWKQGEIQKIIDYCIDDVKITKEVYDYALKNKSLKYKDFNGGVKDVAIDSSKWEEIKKSSMNFSLGL